MKEIMEGKSCKNCLHYELCQYNTYQEAHYFGKDKEIYIKIDNNSPCKFFTDLSEWVHLPCKVGDRIWFIRNGMVAFRPVSKSSIYPIATGGKLGKTAFLTREEAEKALEEKK